MRSFFGPGTFVWFPEGLVMEHGASTDGDVTVAEMVKRIYADYDVALHAKVLEREHVDLVRDEMASIAPMPGVFYPEYVRRLTGTHVKTARTKADMVEAMSGPVV